MKQPVIFLLILLNGVVAQTGTIYADVENDTVTIRHNGSQRNCCSLFDMQVDMIDNQITVTEVDTAGGYCYCNCIFNLSVTLAGLDPGTYSVEVFGTDTCYGLYWGSATFAIGGGIGTYNPVNSGCVPAREDTSFIELTVVDDTLNLFWDTPLINCGLEPVWAGWLAGDSFHVTMTDTGMPADCICPFELSVGFGPFPGGTYTLDFREGEYGYPTFTIGGTREAGSMTVVSGYQSPCLNYVSSEQETQPEDFHLYPAYPNPFNPSTTLSYYLPEVVDVTLAIYDIRGRLVTALVQRTESTGIKSVQWDGTDQNGRLVTAGVYLCRLQAGKQVDLIKMVLLK